MIKFQERIGLEVTHLSITKFIDYKSITNILLNGYLQAFLLKTGLLLSPLFFRIVTETLTSTIRQEQEIKEKKKEERQIKLFLFAEYNILYRTDHKYSTRKLLEMTKVSGDSSYRIHLHKSVAFLYTNANIVSMRL